MGNLCESVTEPTPQPTRHQHSATMQLNKIAVLACTLVCLSLVQSAPVADPEPFVLPTVTGALTIALPAVAIPGFGFTVTSGALASTLNAAASDESTYAQRFYNRNRRDVYRY